MLFGGLTIQKTSATSRFKQEKQAIWHTV